MPATLYTVVYRSEFKQVTVDGASQNITVLIYDTFSPSGLPTFTDLLASGDALHIETVNNDQDPFSPILAKKATFKFLSSASVNSDTFSSGTDERFYMLVTDIDNGINLFQGFVLIDEIGERLRNPEYKNEVVLVATDNIGTLKEQEILFGDDPLPYTTLPVLGFIALCLQQTGITLNINVAWNIWEETYDTSVHALMQTWMHTYTFEKDSETKEDCYTVLTKILSSLKARLFQHNGVWWIVRLHEYRTTDTTLSVITFDYILNVVEDFHDVEVEGVFGFPNADPKFLINADATKTNQRPHKFDKDTNPFELPSEIPRNREFIHGDEDTGIDPYRPLNTYANLGSFPGEGISNEFYKATDTGKYYLWMADIPGYEEVTAKAFDTEGWTLEKFGGSPTVNSYIRRIYDTNNEEKERVVVIEGGANEHWLKSEPIPLHIQDKFNFSVDQRFSDNLTGSSGTYTFFVAMLRLVGDNGTYWNLHGGIGAGSNKVEWVPSNSGFTSNIRYIARQWDITQENEQFDFWNVSVEAPPLPVSGDLYILLRKSDYNNSYDTYFANLQFEYIPFINGNYGKYKAQYNKVTAADPYKANRDDEYKIAALPKKLFKGALRKQDLPHYPLVENWQDAFSGGDPMPLGKVLVYDEWNQYRKPRVLLQGTVKGITQDTQYCLLLHKWEVETYSGTKRFICLNYDYNVKRAEARCTLLEVFDTEEENDYTTAHEFKYVQ